MRFAIWSLFVLSVSAAGATEPYFSFKPGVVTTGGTVTVAGASFSAASAGVNVSVTNAAGQRTSLGAAPLTNGSFTKSFTVPAGLAAGVYTINVVDSAMEGSINLIGPLTVVAGTSPWFTFTPVTVAPGGSVSFTAAGFPGAASGAAVALISSTGQVTVLGTAPLKSGGFNKGFTVPLTLAQNASYTPFVKDSAGHVAQNVSGPLAIGTPPSSTQVGFYPVGVAVNAATNRIYVPVSGSDKVAVIGGSLSKISGGRLPCAVGLNATTNRIYVSNVNSNDVTVIDGGANAVIATVPVGGAPCAVVANPSNNRIFVGNYASSTISVIDGNTNTIVATIAPPSFPAGLGINTVTNRVYTANGNAGSVSVIDATTNSILATVPVGLLPDAVGVNEATNRVYVANYFGGTVTVIDGSSDAVIATVPTGSGPSGTAADPVTNRIYVSNYMSNSVTVIDGATNTVIATIPVGKVPDGIAVNSATQMVYVANSDDNSVSEFAE